MHFFLTHLPLPVITASATGPSAQVRGYSERSEIVWLLDVADLITQGLHKD